MRLGEHKIKYHQMDAETPDIDGPFNLITSSLCMQWFQNRATALEHLSALLAPGGLLIVTTLLDGSLHEWVDTCATQHVPCGVPHYPSLEQLTQDWPNAASGTGKWHQSDITDPVSSAAAFLKGLRDIGASLPRSGSQPATTADLKKAMRHFDAHYRGVTYRVGLGIFRKGIS
ncbi:biotin synthesis protein [Neokomagataea thailandica NBRC 106555]|nr:biotin synthesis protein [Neokomagataea thailandica NBRC 106555]